MPAWPEAVRANHAPYPDPNTRFLPYDPTVNIPNQPQGRISSARVKRVAPSHGKGVRRAEYLRADIIRPRVMNCAKPLKGAGTCPALRADHIRPYGIRGYFSPAILPRLQGKSVNNRHNASAASGLAAARRHRMRSIRRKAGIIPRGMLAFTQGCPRFS